MTKEALRKKYKQLRRNLTQHEIEAYSISIANQLLKLPIWKSHFYHLFLSIDKHNEVNTDYILNILSGKDKHIVISKSDFKTNKLHNYLLTDNTIIQKNSWGIPEPINGIEIDNAKIDIVFVPLLAFDSKGHRVGYGKGFYDNFLNSCNPSIIKVGLSFFEAEREIEDLQANDVSLDYCVTPKSKYNFQIK